MAQILTLVLVITQVIILLFIGGFARTQTALATSYPYLTQSILFLFSWTLMNAPYKKLTLHTLSLLILITAVTFQSNLLLGRFWYSVFNQFTSSYELSVEILSECVMAIFAVLLVSLDFIGIFRYWQIYVILIPIINFGWSFNYCVLRYGLNIFDGCGGLTVFLFSGVVSIAIWVVSVRASDNRFGAYKQNLQENQVKIDLYKRQEYYNGYSISLFGGLIGTFLLWPTYNAFTSYQSSLIVTLNPVLKRSLIFSNSAYTNTILALCIGTCLSFMLVNRDGTKQQKLRIRSVIDCFINSGIICSSFVDLTYNPSAVMTTGLISTVITLVLYWYHQSVQHKKQKSQSFSNFIILVLHFSRALFRMILPLLGIIVTAIVVSSRQKTDIVLLDPNTYGSNIYQKTAGFQIVGYIITFVVALICGVLGGVFINLYLGFKQREKQNKLKQQIQKNQQVNRSQVKDSKALSIKKYKTPKKQNYLNFRRNLSRNQLNDFDFLQLDYYSQSQANSQQIFPLFLQPQDTYIDEQETARKLLKQAILSHVKTNYINVNNYISVNNLKNAENTKTNNTNIMQIPVLGRDHSKVNDQSNNDPNDSRLYPTDKKFQSSYQKPISQNANQFERSAQNSAVLINQRDMIKQAKRKQEAQKRRRQRQIKRLQQMQKQRQRQLQKQKERLKQAFPNRNSPRNSIEGQQVQFSRLQNNQELNILQKSKGPQLKKTESVVQQKNALFNRNSNDDKNEEVQNNNKKIVQSEESKQAPLNRQPSKSQTQLIMPLTHKNNTPKNMKKQTSLQDFQIISQQQMKSKKIEQNLRIDRKLTYDHSNDNNVVKKTTYTPKVGVSKKLQDDGSFILEQNQHQEENSQQI